MTHINRLDLIPDELILHVYRDLEKPAETIFLASTCRKMLGILGSVEENRFFKEIVAQKCLMSKYRGLFQPKQSSKENAKASGENNLSGKIFCLKSQRLTCLFPASIRVYDFNLTVRTLLSFFSEYSDAEIEASLRHDLRTKAGEAFLNLGNELLRESHNHPKYQAIKESLIVNYTAKDTKISARLLELCAPNSNCELTQAFVAMNAAQEELTNAKRLLLTAIAPEVNDGLAHRLKNTSPHTLADWDLWRYSDGVQAAHANLVKKSNEFKTAKKLYDGLNREIESLKSSQLDILKKKSGIDKTTMNTFKALACFYKELDQVITHENIGQRSAALHSFIGQMGR